jgi:hypothetical protein
MAKFRSHAVSSSTSCSCQRPLIYQQLATHHHEMKLNMHYDALLHSASGGASSPTYEFPAETGGAAALERLSTMLQSLLRSMGDKDPVPSSSNSVKPEAVSPDPEASSSTAATEETKPEPEPDQSGEDAEVDLLGMSDWAYTREDEIARLAAENEELRRTLGIDAQTATERGWIAAEEDDDRRMSLILSASSSFSRGSHMFAGGPPRGSGGPGASPDFVGVSSGPGLPPLPSQSRIAQTSWGSVRATAGTSGILVTNAPPPMPPPQPSIGGMFAGLGGLAGNGMSPSAPPMHQQAPPPMQAQPSIPPSPNMPSVPGPGSMRGLQTRRPAMFGQRGGGRGGGPGSSGFWAPPAPEARAWPGLP